MSYTYNYDPGQVVIAFAGIPITGYADGTFASLERNTDSFAMKVGAGGDVTRVRSRDKTARLTLTLQAASPSNDLLSDRLALDEAIGLGTGYGPLLIKELNGTTIAQADVAWVVKPATVEYSAEGSNREWMIDCSNLTVIVGGNVI